jgi:hypothetical protein
MKLHIKTSVGDAKVNLKKEEIESFLSAAEEFDIELSSQQIIEILEENPKIPLDVLIWGVDTPIRDEFFGAIVEKITGHDWDYLRSVHKDNVYDFISAIAKSKGYKMMEKAV